MPDSLKKGLGQRQGPDLQQSNSAGRQLVLSIVPIVVLILIGSLVVGRYEGWDAVDSIYWCVITGTSVGFGDKVPQTGSMRWFCIVYIPLAVGAYSAALGRIANIFVEREIQKNNAKLLQQPCETCWKNLAMLLETTTGTRIRIGIVPAIAPKKERTKSSN